MKSVTPSNAAARVAVGLACSAALAACGGTTNYRPAMERPFQQVAANGCGRDGDRVMVTGQVTQAYENSVSLWDGADPSRTLTVSLPGRGSPMAKMRQWVGKNRYELTAERLNQLSAERQPVTVTLECNGPRVPAVAQSIEFSNPDGTRVAIAY